MTAIAFAQDDPLIIYRAWRQSGYPEWSPDGKFIVFTGGGTDVEEGNLWLVPATGGEPVQLTESGGHHGNFSPDGKLIALDAAQGSIVQVIPATGGTPIRIVPEEIGVEHSGSPCWSPDGEQIVFRANEDLYTVELATGTFTSVFHREGFKPMPIQWLKAENAVITSLIDVESKIANIWRISIDTGEATQITDVLRVTQASVSPDGSMLVYSTFLDADDRDHDLYAIPLAGGEPIQLTEGPIYDLNPVWSPAGDQLAYVVFFEGEFRIQVVDITVEEILEGKMITYEWDPMEDPAE